MKQIIIILMIALVVFGCAAPKISSTMSQKEFEKAEKWIRQRTNWQKTMAFEGKEVILSIQASDKIVKINSKILGVTDTSLTVGSIKGMGQVFLLMFASDQINIVLKKGGIMGIMKRNSFFKRLASLFFLPREDFVYIRPDIAEQTLLELSKLVE